MLVHNRPVSLRGQRDLWHIRQKELCQILCDCSHCLWRCCPRTVHHKPRRLVHFGCVGRQFEEAKKDVGERVWSGSGNGDTCWICSNCVELHPSERDEESQMSEEGRMTKRTKVNSKSKVGRVNSSSKVNSVESSLDVNNELRIVCSESNQRGGN
ncbi:hypothetical protein BLNAU_8487 [Blattamonas nauphoetae]|uniref:Uncharacterized protein n=1 Tax=Blattamonas nauphoetae TaxID=2049346 RepID=A0ABQ9XYV9_9EUKA|nr:hypothetical protein BLNAU_8487 [Blattamonas nauphoetae]